MDGPFLILSGQRAGWPEELPDPKTTHPGIWAAWRQQMDREAAYFRSLHRQPCNGKELEDWVAAEKEVDEYLRDPH